MCGRWDCYTHLRGIGGLYVSFSLVPGVPGKFTDIPPTIIMYPSKVPFHYFNVLLCLFSLSSAFVLKGRYNLGIDSSSGRRRVTVDRRLSGALPKESELVPEQKQEQTREEQLQEATDKLASVGWSLPYDTDSALTSDDPFVQRIDAEIRRDVGVSLDELLNPAKVVNLERDLAQLRLELEECKVDEEARQIIQNKITKKERDLNIERRSVFRGWLKNVFLGQAVLSFVLSWFMVSNPSILFGGFDWYQALQLEMPIKVLGFWWWWLFIVPSLRSRRPGGSEKQALDIAFLATPAISILSPVLTKDPQLIWVANFAVVAGSYAYAFLLPSDDDTNTDDSKQSPVLKFIYKSLDFGTGRERGARK